tara:strand:+ start:75 stop:467 length:393 start_codon:yes stop_codon:yes gene_type:complete
MIMLKKFYLVFMGLTYFAIGAWAIIDPDFTNAVGLQVTSEIGYSEVAGIYGGLNLCIGSMCLFGLFKEYVGIFSIKFLTFLTGSIAFGRIISSVLPNMPGFLNTFFVFEVCACLIGLLLINSTKKSDQIT